MWTVENRARYDHSKLRYPSDLTDQEWSLAKREIPRAKRGECGAWIASALAGVR